MSKLRECPFCGGNFELFKDNYGKYGAYCAVCGIYVGIELECGTELRDGWKAKFESKESLMSFLNRRAQLDNQPLSLEQLRQMDENPVWISEQKSGGQDVREQWQQFAYEQSEYNLMAFWEFGNEVENTYDISDYSKTWLAYAYKPEPPQSKPESNSTEWEIEYARKEISKWPEWKQKLSKQIFSDTHRKDGDEG